MAFDKWDVYFVLIGIVVTFVVLQWAKKLPSPAAVQEVLAALNSRGGNILILSAFSVYFFHDAISLFYNLLEQVKAGTLKPDNAYALMALQFVTTTAFGGFSGALLKTMTGESSKARVTDSPAPSPAPAPPVAPVEPPKTQ